MINNSKLKKKKKSIIQIIGYPALIGICWLLYLIIHGAINDYRIEKNGIHTWAIIYDKYIVGAKGTIQTDYYFEYSGDRFYGYSYWDRNKKIGDSIVVFFLESDPKINTSNSLLKLQIPKDKK